MFSRTFWVITRPSARRSSGSITTPRPMAWCGRELGQHRAVEEHLARRHRVGAGDHPGDFGTPTADQTGEADDLAAIAPRRRSPAGSRRTSRGPRRSHGASLATTGSGGKLTSSRRPSMPTMSESFVSVGNRRRARHLPVAHDRHGVGDLEHLVEEVTDVDQRAAVGGEGTHQRVQAIGLVLGQRRRRLVEDDETSVASEGAHDLDLLLVGETQRRDRHVTG